MKVVQCEKGHYFDRDKYELCPHCGAVPRAEAAGKGTVRSREAQAVETPKSESLDLSISYSDFLQAEPLKEQREELDIPQGKNEPIEEQDIPQGKNEPIEEQDILQRKNEQPSVPDLQIVQPAGYSEPENNTGTRSLQQEIQHASASSDGKTLGFFSRIHGNSAAATIRNGQNTGMNMAAESDATIHLMPANSGTTANSGTLDQTRHSMQNAADPVTGWLVCIAGPHFGESFPIAAGNNSIGRNNKNKIVLSQDMGISKEKHAFLIYEPKKRKFYLQPGDSSGLTYLNDNFITGINELQKNAVIELGSSRLMFIPLCGPEFTWEDYMK